MSAIKSVVAVVATSVLAACASNDPGFVGRQWSQNIRELGIYPVFPPREDFRVGDIYLFPWYAPDCRDRVGLDGPMLLGVLVAAVPTVSDSAKTFYESRIAVPSSVDPKVNVFDARDHTSLRTVGFPAFVSVAVTGAQAAAFLSANGLPLQLGASGQSSSRAFVSVTSAESYAVPMAELLKQMLGKTTDGTGATVVNDSILNAQVRRAFALDGGNVCPTLPGQFELRVINEVIYTRNIDVQVADSSAVGLALTTPTSAGAGGGSAAASAALGVPQAGSSSAADALGASEEKVETSAAAAVRKAEAARQARGGAAAAAAGKQWRVPGGTVEWSQASYGALTLSAKFDRPVAIGYKGLSLCVQTNGHLCGAGPPPSRIETMSGKR